MKKNLYGFIPDSVKKLSTVTGASKLYIVGGWVRNVLASLKPVDIDLAGTLTAHDIEQYLRAAGLEYEVRVVNERLGTCHIIMDEEILEYTPFRLEKYRGGEHTPYYTELTNDMLADAHRRDFACNALYCDAATGEVIDLVNGLQDVEDKVLRAVVDPREVFGSDGLRLMRLVRLAAELGFGIEDRTWTAAQANINLIADISAERIRQELERVLSADMRYGVKDAHYQGLKLMGELGLWEYILPELAACKGVAQNPQYHLYDVYEHTLQAVKFAPPNVRLAALMHDLGKPVALMQDGNMYRHADIGAEIVSLRLGLKGLKYPNTVIKRVKQLVSTHMYDLNGETGESKLRRFVAHHHTIVEDLCALKRADGKATGKCDERPCRILDMYEKMLQEGIPFELKKLEVKGQDVLMLGAEPQMVGAVLEELLDRVVVGVVSNERNKLMGLMPLVIKQLRSKGKGAKDK